MKTLKRLGLFILVSLMVLGPAKEGLAQDFSTGKLELKVESQGNLTLYTNPLLKQGLYLEDVGGGKTKIFHEGGAQYFQFASEYNYAQARTIEPVFYLQEDGYGFVGYQVKGYPNAGSNLYGAYLAPGNSSLAQKKSQDFGNDFFNLDDGFQKKLNESFKAFGGIRVIDAYEVYNRQSDQGSALTLLALREGESFYDLELDKTNIMARALTDFYGYNDGKGSTRSYIKLVGTKEVNKGYVEERLFPFWEKADKAVGTMSLFEVYHKDQAPLVQTDYQLKNGKYNITVEIKNPSKESDIKINKVELLDTQFKNNKLYKDIYGPVLEKTYEDTVSKDSSSRFVSEELDLGQGPGERTLTVRVHYGRSAYLDKTISISLDQKDGLIADGVWSFNNNPYMALINSWGFKDYSLIPRHREAAKTILGPVDYETYDKYYNKKWGGSCFGFSMSVIGNSKGHFNIRDYDSKAGCLFDLKAKNETRSLINAYHRFWMTPLYQNAILMKNLSLNNIELGKDESSYRLADFDRTLKQIKKDVDLYKVNKEPCLYYLAFGSRDDYKAGKDGAISSAHSVIVLDYENIDVDKTRVYLYDPNTVYKKNSNYKDGYYLLFDKAKNEITYGANESDRKEIVYLLCEEGRLSSYFKPDRPQNLDYNKVKKELEFDKANFLQIRINDEKKIKLNGLSFPKEDIFYLKDSSAYGEDGLKTYFLREGSYTIEAEAGRLDINVASLDKNISVKAGERSRLKLESAKTLTFENETGDFEVSQVINDTSADMAYSKIKIKGSGQADLDLSQAKDGIKISGKNLKGLDLSTSHYGNGKAYRIDGDVNEITLKTGKDKNLYGRDKAGRPVCLKKIGDIEEGSLNQNPSLSRKIEGQRTFGANRYDTSLALSRQNFDKAGIVVIASGENFADALAAAPLAGGLKAPILLSPKDKLYPGIKEELTRLGTRSVYIIGGENTLSKAIENDLKASYRTSRVAGKDRYETSAIMLEPLNFHGLLNTKAVLVNGTNFADALAAAPMAVKEGAPILLVEKDQVPGPVNRAIDKFGLRDFYIAGGGNSVSKNVENGMPKLIKRFAGTNRFHTSRLIFDYAFKGVDTAYIASGLSYPDALSAAPLAGKEERPIILGSEGVDRDILSLLEVSNINRIYLVGGPRAIGDGALEAYKGN